MISWDEMILSLETKRLYVSWNDSRQSREMIWYHLRQRLTLSPHEMQTYRFLRRFFNSPWDDTLWSLEAMNFHLKSRHGIIPWEYPWYHLTGRCEIITCNDYIVKDSEMIINRHMRWWFIITRVITFHHLMGWCQIISRADNSMWRFPGFEIISWDDQNHHMKIDNCCPLWCRN